MTKICNKCFIEKTLDCFYIRRHRLPVLYRTECKECIIKDKHKRDADNPEHLKQVQQRSYEKTKIKKIAQKLKYEEEHKEEIALKKQRKTIISLLRRHIAKEKDKIRLRKLYNKNREDILAKGQIYYQENKDKLRPKRRQNEIDLLKRDPQARIRKICRKRVLNTLHNAGIKKDKRTEELIGCTVQEYMAHLEKQFHDNPDTGEKMTWENHGTYGWHIDHIRPCISFDLTDPEQQKACFNYRNCQPLWAKKNLKKGRSWKP